MNKEIRQAVIDDLPELMRMAKFVHYISKGKRWALFEENLDGWTSWFLDCINDWTPRVILVAGDQPGEKLFGFLGATLIAPFCIPTARLAMEHIVWVDKDARKNGYGKKLIEAYIDWAKVQGCSHAYIGTSTKFPGSKKLGELYNELGFTLEERQYIRSL